jgi:ribosomal protein S18 acetylase RimI-like enzyme
VADHAANALPDGWRPLTNDDLPALFRLEYASDAADGERFPTTLDGLSSLLHTPDIALERMSMTIEAGAGRLVGWCGMEPRIGGATWNRIHVHGSVHPDARGRGLGRALLRWAENQAPAIFEPAGQRALELPDVLTVHAGELATGRARLHEHCGYELRHWYWDMFRSLAEPLTPAPLPEGYRFVSWTNELDGAFHAADVDGFGDHWGSAPWSFEAWRHEFADDDGFRPDLTVGVERDGEIVAYVMVAAYEGMEDDHGRPVAWLARLAVRSPHRSRGIGAAAITRVMALAREAGFATAGLDVDTENVSGALRLYERLGFYPVKRLALRSKMIREAGAR